jgi:hypothetical protein
VMGFLMPMIAAGAMSFSSIFVVTNSLRLRGYDVRVVGPPKPLARQVLELVPYLILPAVTLGVLIALSIGWLQPVRFGEFQQSNRPSTTFRAFIDNQAAIKPGISTPLDIQIVDQFGRRFDDFELGAWGSFVSYGSLAVVSRDLTSIMVTKLVLDPYMPISGESAGKSAGGMGGNMLPGGASAPSAQGDANQPGGSAIAPAQLTFANRVIQPNILFPKEGQYVAFVSFYPNGGDEVLRRISLQVGAAKIPPAALSTDSPMTQSIGDLKFSLQHAGRLKSRQYQYLSIEVVDTKGQPHASEIVQRAGNQIGLYLVDEGLTTFVAPDFINRYQLLFSAYFPKPGKYKAWFEFLSANKIQQVPFVVEVE